MDVKAQRDQFLAFAFAAADLLVEVDRAGRIRFAVGASSLLGADEAGALAGLPLKSLLAHGEGAGLQRFLGLIAPARRMGPLRVETAGGDRVAISGWAAPDRRDRLALAIRRDDAPASAAGLARSPATGLVTHEAFEPAAAAALRRLRDEGREAQLTLLTLTKQNELLDRVGPARGESLLSRLGDILRAHAVDDAASEVGEGRYSLIHEAAVDAAAVEQSLMEAARAVDPAGEGVSVKRSTLTVEGDLTPEEAARAVMFALNAFAEGQTSPEGFCGLSDALEAMASAAGARILDLRREIADKRVAFVAQPIVALATRKVSHYEVLARFADGRSPLETVCFAEKTGVVAELDMAALEAAFAALKDAKDGGLSLAVNLSGASIANPAFITRILRRLLDFRAPRTALSFEITESAEIVDLKAADEAIQKLRKLGHRVFLDDFGAGAASFPYLRALAIDGVKIDGAYVARALSSRRDALLLKAMAGLCRDLGAATAAEMVETEAQAAHLASLGVEFGQGFLFGRPEPIGALRQAA